MAFARIFRRLSPRALWPALSLALSLSLCALGLSAPNAAAQEILQLRSPGGIEFWLRQERSIPILSLEIAWRKAGSAHEPAEKAGLARLLAAALTEGAGPLDAQAFQTRLKDLAGSLNFSATPDEFRGSLRTLSENRQAMFELLASTLMMPRFDPEPMSRLRQQTLQRLRREQEDPSTLASQLLWRTAFPNHPYGRNHSGTTDSLPLISVRDLQAFLDNRLARDALVIGMVGDIESEEAGRLVDLAFAPLPMSALPSPLADAEPKLQMPPVILERDNPQSQIRFMSSGIRRADPDYYAAMVVNYVLGGGSFNSRLMEEVREKQGLVYSIYSALVPMDYGALSLGGFGTQNERAGEALAIVRREIEKIHGQGITAEELKNAKTFLNGSFPLSLSSNSQIAGLLVQIQLDRLGADYLSRRAELINAVTLEDVRRVAGRLFDPQNLLVVVVGRPVGIGG